MRSITKKCAECSDDRTVIKKIRGKIAVIIKDCIRETAVNYHSIEDARKMFEAGLQMCEELEAKQKAAK